MSDLFDMEQEIMNCWHVVDDLKVVYHHMERLDQDGQDNLLLGLASLYQLKFEILFECFEKMCAERAEAKCKELGSNHGHVKGDGW